MAACSGAKLTELDGVSGSSAPTHPAPRSGNDDGGKPKDDGNDKDSGPREDSDGGVPEEENVLCDDGLALASTDPFDAAKAIGLCKKASGGSGSGVISAKLTKPDGSPVPVTESWGLLPKLGPNTAPSGKVMLALSTGTARAPGDPGYQSPTGFDKSYSHAAPVGQPKHASVCPTAESVQGTPHDGVALELAIRVPNDAKSMSFTHQLFTSDYSDYVCSQYNDVFVVLMEPKPAGTDGNIVFDALGNPLGVNSAALLRACAPGVFGGLTFACPLGSAPLAGTGFENKASTGWLRTTVPVQGGTTITLRFAIWDSADGILDSTALIDELTFSGQPAKSAETVPR